jgi:hypothetical protein
VRHNSTFDHENEGNWMHVMDIHSHGSMGAFWSGVDDADEKRVTTERLFGVIGKVQQPVPEWKWRMRTRDGFIEFNIADIFDLPKKEVNFSISSEVIFRSMGDPTLFKDGKVMLNCPVDPFVDVEVPAEWYENVKSYSFQNTHSSVGHSYQHNHTPAMVKGFIYVGGSEYEVDGPVVKATGHRIVKKGDTLPAKVT